MTVAAVFGEAYADAYDALYEEKDYARECDLLERVFREYGSGSVRSVLDLGCGTGNHAIPLAERGYQVHGVDISELMLAHARQKAEGQPALSFSWGDVRSVELGQVFDSALLMFAVLGYQISNDDVIATLRTARRHLRDGAIFFFDAWYGPAVETERPAQRIKTVPLPGGEILRAARGALHTGTQTCTVKYDLWRIEGDRVAQRTHESHTIRYFFPMEIRLLLELCDFELLRLGVFPEIDVEPSERSWNVCAVARARRS